MEVSSIEKLDLKITFAVKPKDYKEAFRKNRFCNVIETHLSFYQGKRRNDLAVAMLKSIPNVKKLHIASNHLLHIKTLEAININCRKLEFLILETGNGDDLYTEEDLAIAIPSICKGLPNLQFVHFKDWNICLKDARDLLLHSEQLQAILNQKELMVRSTAQMSEVARFLEETEMTEVARILERDRLWRHFGDPLHFAIATFHDISFF
jgi:hypothetical protein